MQTDPPANGRDPAPSELHPIVQPYLLVLFGVPSYLGEAGARFLDPLWAKDLIEHTRYIENLALAAPAIHGPAPANAVAVDAVPALSRVRWIDLPAPRSGGDAIRLLPRTLRLLWRASRSAKLVHSAIVGWPIPEAWMLAPMLALLPRPHYINVESASWRLLPGERAALARRFV